MNFGVEASSPPVSSMAAMGATSTLHNSLATYMTQQVQPNLLFGLGQQQQASPAQQQPLNLQTNHQGQPTMQPPPTPHQPPGAAPAPPTAAPPLPLNLHNPYYVSLGPMLPLPMSTPPQHNPQQQFQQNMLQQQQSIPGGFNQHTMYQWGKAASSPTHYPSSVPAQHRNHQYSSSYTRMPALVGSYQYTWSMAQNNTLASSRQVNFAPPSFAPQPQHPYLASNSVPQLPPSQHFPHVHHPPVPASHLSSTTQHQPAPVTLTQPLCQHQVTNCSRPVRTTEHQKSPIVETASQSPAVCTTSAAQSFSTCNVSPPVQHTLQNATQNIYSEDAVPNSSQWRWRLLTGFGTEFWL